MDNQRIKLRVSKEQFAKAPTTTGVYLFNVGNEIVYIGKSVNLKARLISHWENARIDAKESAIITNSDIVEYILTDSEFKALLLESQLIRKYKPKYNARWRDDKSPLYIKITIKDEYPKIYSIRKEFDKKSRYFGPFPSVKSVYEILREIRRVFPFCTQKHITKRPCFHAKIGLCNPCPNVIEQTKEQKNKRAKEHEYRRNIRSIIKVLDGKTGPVLDNLYKQLKTLSKKEKFEQAITVRDRIMHFESLLHRKLFSPDTVPAYNLSTESIESLRRLLLPYYPDLPVLSRIECIDVSNFAQKEATASLVVFSGGLMDKKEYRRFKIRNLSLRSDFEMMREVLLRRLKQSWPFPNMLVVDGGKPQVRMMRKALIDGGISVPLIGIAKHPDRLIIGVVNLPMVRPSIHHLGFNLIRAMRDESHRFAKKYHVLLREKRNALNFKR